MTIYTHYVKGAADILICCEWYRTANEVSIYFPTNENNLQPKLGQNPTSTPTWSRYKQANRVSYQSQHISNETTYKWTNYRHDK